MTKIDTYEFWDEVIDYYFDHVWPEQESIYPSIINWIEENYKCRMNGNVAEFDDPAYATLFKLRWA